MKRSNWIFIIQLFIFVLSIVVPLLFDLGIGGYTEDQIITYGLLIQLIVAIFLLEWNSDRRIDQYIDTSESMLVSARKFFVDTMSDQDVPNFIKGAKKVDILAVSLYETVRSCYPQIEENIISGCKFRIILTTMDEDTARMVSYRSTTQESVEVLQQQFNQVKKHLSKLSARGKNGLLNVKTSNFPPSFGIIIKDEGKRSSAMLVKIYGHSQVKDAITPAFWIFLERDTYWYEYFHQQFLGVWSGDNVVDLKF